MARAPVYAGKTVALQRSRDEEKVHEMSTYPEYITPATEEYGGESRPARMVTIGSC